MLSGLFRDRLRISWTYAQKSLSPTRSRFAPKSMPSFNPETRSPLANAVLCPDVTMNSALAHPRASVSSPRCIAAASAGEERRVICLPVKSFHAQCLEAE